MQASLQNLIKLFNPRPFFPMLVAIFVRKIMKKVPVNLEKMLEKNLWKNA
jgi:hypothetical protein